MFNYPDLPRLEKLLSVLHARAVLAADGLLPLEYRAGKPDFAQPQGLRPFAARETWGGDDADAWFRAVLTIPPQWANTPVWVEVNTGREEEKDIINPQLLAYVNGREAQGLDRNHAAFCVTQGAAAGAVFTLDFDAWFGLANEGASWTNSERAPCCFLARAFVRDADVQALYWDIKTPYDVAALLKADDENRLCIVRHLTAAANLLDLRDVSSNGFSASVKDALAYLQTEFYEKECGKGGVTAYLIGHTHIDVAWLWSFRHTRRKTARSFATALALMQAYPDYAFMSSQPQLYAYLKQDHPALYARVRVAAKEKRWFPEGVMWLEADCNLTSGESLVRQMVYGKRFFREEFGTDSRVLWLPDVFGYCAALPQICKQCGVDYFMTTKINWNDTNQIPNDTFYWVGLDGSRVLTHFIPARNYDEAVMYDASHPSFFTTYNCELSANQVMGGWKRYANKDISNCYLLSYGFGDGGGGTTREMVEQHARMRRGIPGCPTTKHIGPREFFETLEQQVQDNPRTPEWHGELYFEYHRGTYTSVAKTKRNNRRAEYALTGAEFALVLAQACGAGALSFAERGAALGGADGYAGVDFAEGGAGGFATNAAAADSADCDACTDGVACATGGETGARRTPREHTDAHDGDNALQAACAEIHALWPLALTNQFHDILPGSSITQVYDDVDEIYAQIFAHTEAVTQGAYAAIARRIDAPEGAVVVFNPLGFARGGVVALPEGCKAQFLCDAAGRVLPMQLVCCEAAQKIDVSVQAAAQGAQSVAENAMAKAVEDAAISTHAAAVVATNPSAVRLCHIPEMPGMGYTVLTPCAAPTDEVAHPTLHVRSAENGTITYENGALALRFAENGQFASVFDLCENREILPPGKHANVLACYEDRPCHYDAWDLDLSHKEHCWEICADGPPQLIENGPVRAVLRCTAHWMESAIRQDIIVYPHSRRIDFATTVDWQQENLVLKAAFPVDVFAETATFDVQFGTVERPTHSNTSWDFAKFETCAHKWADVSEGESYGVSLLSDSKYGFDVHGGVLSITLLKSAMYPARGIDKGLHTFTYALYAHSGSWRAGGTVGEGYALNVPLNAVCVPAKARAQSGAALPLTFSAASCHTPGVIAEVLKPAENGEGTVLRAYEMYGRRVDAVFALSPCASVTHTNLLEEPLASVTVENGRFTARFKPYEIKTFLIKPIQERENTND